MWLLEEFFTRFPLEAPSPSFRELLEERMHEQGFKASDIAEAMSSYFSNFLPADISKWTSKANLRKLPDYQQAIVLRNILWHWDDDAGTDFLAQYIYEIIFELINTKLLSDEELVSQLGINNVVLENNVADPRILLPFLDFQVNPSLGAYLKGLREDLGYSKQISKFASEVGLPASNISRWENNLTLPNTFNELLKITNRFGLSKELVRKLLTCYLYEAVFREVTTASNITSFVNVVWITDRKEGVCIKFPGSITEKYKEAFKKVSPYAKQGAAKYAIFDLTDAEIADTTADWYGIMKNEIKDDDEEVKYTILVGLPTMFLKYIETFLEQKPSYILKSSINTIKDAFDYLKEKGYVSEKEVMSDELWLIQLPWLLKEERKSLPTKQRSFIQPHAFK